MSYIDDVFSLKGKNAVVTGGASGLGRQCARALAKAGANVALMDINPEGMQETALMIGDVGVELIHLQVDVQPVAAGDAGYR